MTTIAIVQARMGSTRLPNKVMRCIGGTPMIELLLKRLNKSRRIDKIILATSKKSENKTLVEHVESLGFKVFEGSEKDVLDRYYQVARRILPETVVRITGDCPLIDPVLVDEVIKRYELEQSIMSQISIRLLSQMV